MFDNEDLRNKSPEEIQKRIEQTRARLQERVESLKCEINGEVNSVKGCIQDTVDNVKGAIDVREYIKVYPYKSLGGGLLLGLLVGSFLSSKNSRKIIVDTFVPHPEKRSTSTSSPYNNHIDGGSGHSSGKLGAVLDHFAPEITELKRFTIGSLTAPFRELVRANVPCKFSSRVDEVFDSVIRKV